METAKPSELKTLHVGKTRKTHSSKSHHGLRKWNSSLHHASSMKSFRTTFTHEHRNCIIGGRHDTANARMLAAHEKVFVCISEHVTTHVQNQKGIGRRSSWCSVYIQELTRNTYDNLNYRSEKRLKRLQNDSTMDLISFTMVAREAGAIPFWLVYSSNITV